MQGVLGVQPGTHNSLEPDGEDDADRLPSVAMAVPKGTVVFYAPSLRHRGGVHKLKRDRMVWALTLQSSHALAPCGIPVTVSHEDVGRWWLVDGRVHDKGA